MSCEPARNRKISSFQNNLNKYLKNTYALIQNRNLDNFLKKIGVDEETRQRAVKAKSTIRLTKKLKDYTLKTTYEGGQVNLVTFELGKPLIRHLTNGSRVASVFYTNGNKLEEKQCTQGRTITLTRTFGPEYVVVTVVADNERCERFFKKVKKPDYEDIRSETSRRTFCNSETSTPSTKSSVIESEIEMVNII